MPGPETSCASIRRHSGASRCREIACADGVGTQAPLASRRGVPQMQGPAASATPAPAPWWSATPKSWIPPPLPLPCHATPSRATTMKEKFSLLLFPLCRSSFLKPRKRLKQREDEDEEGGGRAGRACSRRAHRMAQPGFVLEVKA